MDYAPVVEVIGVVVVVKLISTVDTKQSKIKGQGKLCTPTGESAI